MSGAPPAKRTRSDSNASDIFVASDGETNCTTASRESKNYSIYKDPRYSTVMDSKRSYMCDFKEGPLSKELVLLKELQSNEVTLPDFYTLPRKHLRGLRELLRNRSESRVCTDLHTYLVPSAEFLAMLYPDTIKDLAEGHNDRWLDNTTFYKKLPQPDRTVAFAWSAFDETECRKLELNPESKSKSPFVAGNGMLFPFFTAEVKCGKEALDVADNANLNSMSVALRAVVELYQRADQLSQIHRRFLAFSMSHDDGSVRIYGHYPWIDGTGVSFYRREVRNFSYTDKDAEEGATAARFVCNLYTHYAPRHLQRLKKTIGALRDPLAPVVNPPALSQSSTVSADVTTPLTPATSTSGPTFAKPGPPARHNSTTVTKRVEQQHAEMMAHLERLRQEAKEREDQLRQEAKQQQEEAKERETKLLIQLEQLLNQLAQLRQEAKEREDQLRQEAKQQQQEAKEREIKLQARLEHFIQMPTSKPAPTEEAVRSVE